MNKRRIQIYVDKEKEAYIVLKTRLGWLALSLDGLSTYGGLQKTQEEALSGLKPTGFVLDVKASAPYTDNTQWDDKDSEGGFDV